MPPVVPSRHRHGLSVFETAAWVLVVISALGGIGAVLTRRHVTPTRAAPDPQNPPVGAETDAENQVVAEHDLGLGLTPRAAPAAGTMTSEEAVRATLADLASRID